MPQPGVFRQEDFSGAVQSSTTRLLRKRNEVLSSTNAMYSYKIGGAARRLGYEQLGYTVQYGNDSLGAHVFRYGVNNRPLIGINNANNTNTSIQFLDVGGYWTSFYSNIDPNMRLQFADANDQCFVTGKVMGANDYMPMLNIDSQLNVSTTRNVYTAPAAKFIAPFQGNLYALNCQIGNVNYKDRFYFSSAALGYITLVSGPQQGLLTQLRVNSVKYIKVGMQLDIYKGGQNAIENTALTVIWVDKVNNNFGFLPTQINVSNTDEVWLTGTHGLENYFWNTDWPTPQQADFKAVPRGQDDNAEITGWGLNNNRLLIFTQNSIMKWDGANLVTISNQVGTMAHETIQTISNWTLFLHTTGVWGYNDAFGQLKLLSRSVDNYFKAMSVSGFKLASAVASGRQYKLAIGQLQTLDASTTSTSTSSTSTSSTSVSTSSTSTSSTSLSSTSSSSSTFTTSTSSTSVSSTSVSTTTSSTSTSISSTSSTSSSISTSTSSTTTTTTMNTTQVTRLVYDFDMNIWWPEVHTRDFRFQFMHTMNGLTKPYFTDNTGKVFRDETTSTDAGDPIPFMVELGPQNFGTEQVKNYSGCYVMAENSRTAEVFISVTGGYDARQQQYISVGQIELANNQIAFPQNLNVGREISYKIVHNDIGDRPVISGITSYYSLVESQFGRASGRL